MKDIQYLKTLKESYRDYGKNKSLIGYFLFSFVIPLLIVPFLVIELIILNLINPDIIRSEFEIGMATGVIVLVVLFIIIDLVILIILGSMARSMLIGMIYDVATKKRTKLSNVVPYMKKYWKQIVGAKMIILAIVFTIMIVLALLTALFFAITPLLGILFAVLFVLIIIALSFFIGVFMIFLEPIIVIKKKRAVESLRLAINYAKKNFTHAILTWLVALVVGIIVVAVLNIVALPVMLPIELTHDPESLALIIARGVKDFIIQIIAGIIGIGVVMFIFRSYIKANS